MKGQLWLLSIEIQNFLLDEGGQDLVEYALAVALIACGACAGMQTLANGINAGFSNIGAAVSGISPTT